MGYFENYTPEEISQIVKQSNSIVEVARKMGYSHHPSGDTMKMLREKLQNYNTTHFYEQKSKTVARSEENIFIENSTASQKILRTWYKAGNYTDYKCAICGQEPLWQEKELTLILDHINGINNDDRLENLRWVCPNCNQQLETTGSKNPNRKIFVKKYYCIDCGKEISKDSKRCVECNAKNKTIALDDMPITREELKNLIRTSPFTIIGSQYGVSDNAIRKWCDKFKLPRKKSEIKNYSDEEWSKI